ncbi:MAG: NYN domain-containing protein, partial [Anaerolineales bacterium]|nr:NYN domain-containing protein [Anaerolineales bacterium]
PYFIRSAFEVIDCPPLTQQGKTSTDIHLVMDALDTLDHPTGFREFIILSGDADFTPVLLRLRKHNRLTSVLSASPNVSPAYKASCDHLISHEDLIRLGLGISLEDEEPAAQASTEPKASKALLNKMAKQLYEAALLPHGIVANELPKIYLEFNEFKNSDQWLGYNSLRYMTEAIIDTRDDLLITGDDPWRVIRKEEVTDTTESQKAAVSKWIQEIVSEAPAPVTMASLASGVIQRFGQEIRTSDWLGADSFKGLLTQLDLGKLKLAANTPGYVYEPGRHKSPGQDETPEDEKQIETLATPVGVFSVKHPDLAPLAWKINQLTETPYWTPEHYQIVIDEIAREIEDNNGYQWARTSKTVRDRSVEKGVPASRAQINFILSALYYSGYPLGKEIPVDKSRLAEKLIEKTISLCQNAQLQLSDEDIELIHRWIRAE